MSTYRQGGPPPQRTGGPSGRRGPPPRGYGDQDTFWANYLKDGYFDTEGNLRQGLVVDDAREIARRLAQWRSGRGEFAPTQLRRFYGKAKYLEQQLNAGTPFQNLAAELRTLQPLAAEAVAKEKAPREFEQFFINKNIPLAAVDQRAFQKGFLVHFESVVAYFSYFKKVGGGS